MKIHPNKDKIHAIIRNASKKNYLLGLEKLISIILFF